MTPPRDPDSGKGRVPRDYSREVARPGPHVDLDETADDLAEVTPVEALTDAAGAVGEAARSLAAHAISRDEAAGIRMRLANLEAWRAGDVDPWRLRLTGVADTNGRLGRVDDAVTKLREDVGPSEARRKERDAVDSLRGDRKRVVAALVAAFMFVGGGLYAIRDRYDAAVKAGGVDEEWRRHVDDSIKTLFGLLGFRAPVSDPGSKP